MSKELRAFGPLKLEPWEFPVGHWTFESRSCPRHPIYSERSTHGRHPELVEGSLPQHSQHGHHIRRPRRLDFDGFPRLWMRETQLCRVQDLPRRREAGDLLALP